MAKLAEFVACTAGVVAATWLLAGSTAFSAGFQVTMPPTRALGQGRGEAPEELGIGASAAPLSVGVAIGVAAAALMAVNRGLVVRKASTWSKVDVKDEWYPQWGKLAPKEGEELKKEQLAIPYPEGTEPWVEQTDNLDLWYVGGPNTGPVGFYKHGRVFADGLVGSEYHGGGRYEFDPLSLANRYCEHLPWYREAELKHGRVAMLACVGLIAPDGFRLPFDACSGKDLDMMTAHNKLIGPGLGEGPMWWLLIFCGIIESIRFKQLGLGFQDLTLENAGDLNFGKGFLPKTKDGEVQMRVKELKNGRLAMLAFSGAITQGILWETHHFPFVPN